MQAVILAAGQGSRIRDHHELPKGFLAIGEQPIIVESIEKLKQHGIKEILIVTGYASEYYESLAETDSTITTFFNAEYSNSSSLFSLYCAKDWVKEDCLIVESDLLYDKRAIAAIINDAQPNIVLLSGATQSDDEVYVQANNKLLVDMSKQPDTLNQDQIYGEFVGINKLCYSDFQYLIQLLEQDQSLLQTGHYEEDGLVALAKQRAVYCLKIADLLWCEIDNTAHLKRAVELHKQLAHQAESTKYAT